MGVCSTRWRENVPDLACGCRVVLEGLLRFLDAGKKSGASKFWLPRPARLILSSYTNSWSSNMGPQTGLTNNGTCSQADLGSHKLPQSAVNRASNRDLLGSNCQRGTPVNPSLAQLQSVRWCSRSMFRYALRTVLAQRPREFKSAPRPFQSRPWPRLHGRIHGWASSRPTVGGGDVSVIGNDTIYALSSGSGRAGIAVVRISGPGCLDVCPVFLFLFAASRCSPTRRSTEDYVRPKLRQSLDLPV